MLTSIFWCEPLLFYLLTTAPAAAVALLSAKVVELLAYSFTAEFKCRLLYFWLWFLSKFSLCSSDSQLFSPSIPLAVVSLPSKTIQQQQKFKQLRFYLQNLFLLLNSNIFILIPLKILLQTAQRLSHKWYPLPPLKLTHITPTMNFILYVFLLL